VKRILKKNVDLEFDPNEYEWIILVGADPTKYFLKNCSVTDYSGKVVDEKYIPIINPAMISFKPEAEKLWLESKDSLLRYVLGEQKVVQFLTDKFYGIQEEEHAFNYVQAAIDSPNPFVAIDSETTGLYPRDGHILGISLCYERDHGAYIDSNCISERVEAKFQELFNKKKVIFHNAKFDMWFFWYHFGWIFPDFEDTMLLHYCLDENPGSHGLKQLALKMTVYGDYEAPLQQFMDEDRKKHGILKDNYTWDRIPFDIMKTYAAIDSVVTFLIYCKLKPTVQKNPKIHKVYTDILLPATRAVIKMQDNGVPFDRARLQKAQQMMQKDIDDAVEKLYENPAIRQFEQKQGKEFNPGSTQQLRILLFDELGLRPTGKQTGTGADSTDKEVLAALSEQSEVPQLILSIRQKAKIKNTYLDKILPALDGDSRLRTNFNLHSTTSGRLSSSGKLNMQQLPRDNPAVKGCIKARPGFKIVSMDLTTAEVYVAAVLSKDKELQKIFQEKGDFHSAIAKKVFRLTCPVEDVRKLYPGLRQAAKAITFGIMYGAGPGKVSETVNKEHPEGHFSKSDAEEAISDYFRAFKGLGRWIAENQSFIAENGFTYSHFGRKRRLPNVFSSDRAIRGHTIRSGLNFLVQSPASDVNLLGAIEMVNFIEEEKMKARMFALVHDSILGEVSDDELDKYQVNLQRFVQKDRGISIPGCPIGTEFEIGDDYSFGKYEIYEREWDELHLSTVSKNNLQTASA
jgi:DNA polymerase I-like protein with 3'-5' exonuclease and polymerase domains